MRFARASFARSAWSLEPSIATIPLIVAPCGILISRSLTSPATTSNVISSPSTNAPPCSLSVKALYLFGGTFSNRNRPSESVSTEPHQRVAPCVVESHLTSRSEEHTSELQSLRHLVCRLLLEK